MDVYVCRACVCVCVCLLQWFVDGGLVRHIPALPAAAGAEYVAGVSCVPFKFLESLPGVSRLQLLHSLAVSPDMFGTFPFGWHEVGGLVLAPAGDPVLLQVRHDTHPHAHTHTHTHRHTYTRAHV